MLKELREKLQRLHARSKELLERVAARNNEWTNEENEEWERISAEILNTERSIERCTQVDERGRTLETPERRTRGAMDGAEDRGGSEEPTDEQRREARSAAFSAYLQRGYAELPPETREQLEWRENRENRSQATSPDTAGGYLVPEGFVSRLEVAMKQFGGLLGAGIEVITTETGNRLPWPTMDDTSAMGYIIGENVADSAAELAFKAVGFDAHIYILGIFIYPVQLIQDAAIDVQGVVATAAGVRIGRRLAQDLAIGDGASKPRGITVAAPVGKTTAANNAITYGEVIDAQHSVDPAYRMNARWVFSDSVFSVLRKIVDGDSRPIWQPAAVSGMAGAAPSTLAGAPYTVDNSFPTFAASAVAAVFGYLAAYKLRAVRGTTAVVMRERYAEKRQIGYSLFARYDGDLVDAGMGPVKSLKMAS